MEDESELILLVQHYAARFGITFNSRFLDDPECKSRLIQLMGEALAGRRGAVLDEDLD